LASAYNTTPELFGRAWLTLRSKLADHGKTPDTFPNALSTMWCYITDDSVEADRILRERVAPVVHRPEDMLRERLAIGSAELFAEKLTAFAKAGVQRVFIWPVADELHQLDRFWNEVRPLVAAT
jgi:alkanesulfonate monooxygenase SsuD/methylene tetrahydromethanopterin reductase-like flavin-dependent oxidoreductase (luciferase family)